jgi:D-3-phosphoglycerate dehydrogenase
VTRVFITEAVAPEVPALLRAGGCSVVDGQDMTAAERAGAMADAAVWLVRILPLPGPYPAGLRMISKHGVGVDNIDLAAARAAGVIVTNTPGANAGAVAEFALGQMISLARGFGALSHDGPKLLAPGLGGRRLLVIGFGASGQRVAALAAAFGMEVWVYSPRLAGDRTPKGHRIVANWRAVLGSVDVVSLHCPLTPETRGMIGREELSALPRGAIIVNTARGGIIDQAALGEALASGHVAGAVLDVTEPEPLPPADPLRHAPNLVLTPHVAGLSAQAFRETGLMAARNILDFVAGRADPAHVVVP